MDWFFWLFGGLSALFTIFPAIMYFWGDPQEKAQGVKMFVGWWGGVAALAATTLVMMFVVKPAIGFILNLF